MIPHFGSSLRTQGSAKFVTEARDKTSRYLAIAESSIKKTKGKRAMKYSGANGRGLPRTISTITAITIATHASGAKNSPVAIIGIDGTAIQGMCSVEFQSGDWIAHFPLASASESKPTAASNCASENRFVCSGLAINLKPDNVQDNRVGTIIH